MHNPAGAEPLELRRPAFQPGFGLASSPGARANEQAEAGFMTPREANADLQAEITALRDRLASLTRENAELQGALAQASSPPAPRTHGA